MQFFFFNDNGNRLPIRIAKKKKKIKYTEISIPIKIENMYAFLKDETFPRDTKEKMGGLTMFWEGKTQNCEMSILLEIYVWHNSSQNPNWLGHDS